MGKVIHLPLPASLYRAAHSIDSAELQKRPLASVVPLRSRRPRILVGFAPAGTTSPRAGKAGQDRGPCRPAKTKSQICLEGLAFPQLIMDDKSMQPWTSLQLTLPGAPRTIRVVGRPNAPSSPAAYRAAFYKRVRTARELFSEDYKEMAHALGIAAGTYYRYETRTMLPHHLMPRFCQITGVTADWLVNGPSAARALTSHRLATGTDPT